VAVSFDKSRESLMDKYELLLALNDLLRTPKEEEAPSGVCAKRKMPTSNGCLKPLLKSSSQAPNN
jgi:hypothetical protein